MTDVIEKAIDRIRSWPRERQEDLLLMLHEIECAGVGVHELTREEQGLVQIGLDQADRGEFVSDADMDAFWRRNRRP